MTTPDHLHLWKKASSEKDYYFAEAQDPADMEETGMKINKEIHFDGTDYILFEATEPLPACPICMHPEIDTHPPP